MTFKPETAFTMDTSSIKFGPGVTREVGYDMKRLGATRVMVVTDPNLAQSEPVAITLEALQAEGIDAVLFDQVRVEPTDASFKLAIEFASQGNFDGYVALSQISASDGRLVQFKYVGNYLSEVIVNPDSSSESVLRYTYQSVLDDGCTTCIYTHLKAVTLPNGLEWKYDYYPGYPYSEPGVFSL